ncbi:DUF6270 domain-containing protein [Terrabacter koreensis]
MTVAIWGSCVTRDIFEVVPAPGATLQYHARSSWVSQASERSDPPIPTPDGTGFGHRTVREDLVKAIVPALQEASPELIIFDLIDERFDVVVVGEGRYTLNDYYTRLGLEDALRAEGDDLSAFRDADREELFAEAVAVVAPQLIESLPQTKFVLHQAWYTARCIGPDAEFYASAGRHVAWTNARLAHHYTVLIAAFGNRLHVVEPDRAECLVADSEHRWGLAHYHYVPEYYEQAGRQLAAIRSGPLLAEPAAVPTPPTPAESGAEHPERVPAAAPTSDGQRVLDGLRRRRSVLAARRRVRRLGGRLLRRIRALV